MVKTMPSNRGAGPNNEGRSQACVLGHVSSQFGQQGDSAIGEWMIIGNCVADHLV